MDILGLQYLNIRRVILKLWEHLEKDHDSIGKTGRCFENFMEGANMQMDGYTNGIKDNPVSLQYRKFGTYVL